MIIQRGMQLFKASIDLLRTEGVGALGDRLRRWLKGERRYAPAPAVEAAPPPSTPPIMPPEEWQRAIGSKTPEDFVRIGRVVFDDLIELAGLTPDSQVLDVGCGIGRVAIPLLGYLSPQGGYAGFDVVKPMIRWCQENITPRYPNFHFDWANVYDDQYSKSGSVPVKEYRFPYEDARFDVIFLASVFTHLRPDDVNHYLGEIRRVLKPGGKCLITCFLLNEESEALIQQPDSEPIFTFPVRYPDEHYAILDAERPCAAVAYEQDFMFGMVTANGLKVVEPIHWGKWPGRKQWRGGQDILILTCA